MAKQDRRLEQAVFVAVLVAHPERLTAAELATKMAGAQGPERDAVAQEIDDLCGSGLLRRIGEVVEPTHAALRATELLELI
jgi:hypothetical protein